MCGDGDLEAIQAPTLGKQIFKSVEYSARIRTNEGNVYILTQIKL